MRGATLRLDKSYYLKKAELADLQYNGTSYEYRLMLAAGNTLLDYILATEGLNDCSNLNAICLSDHLAVGGDVSDVLLHNPSIRRGISLKHNSDEQKSLRISERTTTICGCELTDAERTAIKDTLSVLTPHIGSLWHRLDVKPLKLCQQLTNIIFSIFQRTPSDVLVNGIVQTILGTHDYYKAVLRTDPRKSDYITVYPINVNGSLPYPKTNFGKIKHLYTNIPDNSSLFSGLTPEMDEAARIYMITTEYWKVNFRLHNASSKVEDDLKFSIEISIPDHFAKTLTIKDKNCPEASLSAINKDLFG